MIRYLNFILFLIIYLIQSNELSCQSGNDWKVWVKTDPCAGRHDWISVAKENPTSYGLSYYEAANYLFPQTACTTFGCTFAEATNVANTLKFTDEFFDYCCRDYSVWENPQTRARTVVVGKFGTAGLGWILLKTDLCCEEAEALAGVQGACSGNTGHQNDNNNSDNVWKVWVKTSPCSGRHDWISVAKENPTTSGLNYYELANNIFPQTLCTTFGCTFSEATVVANSLKTTDVFFRYCCRDYSVWENTQTRARTVVVGKFGTAGPGWLFIKGDLCCEEAESLSGIPNACSGRDQIQCWPGSYAAWNPQSQKMECFCNPGTVWDAAQQACVQSAVDCSAYANSEPRWDATTNQYLCYCKQGFVWNDTRTACIPTKPDCSQYYKNTYAVWDASINNYRCECNQGFVWDASKNECVSTSSQVPDCNLYYKNTYAVWDPSINNYRCNCNQGYVWDATKNECVSSGGNQDNPYVKPELQKNGDCNIQYQSGANEPEQYTIDVKRNYGSLNFSFQTYDVKDRIHIYQSGAKVFDSGCVGSSGSQTLTLNGSSSVFTIIVDPRCDQNPSSTSWNFTLGCPN